MRANGEFWGILRKDVLEEVCQLCFAFYARLSTTSRPSLPSITRNIGAARSQTSSKTSFRRMPRNSPVPRTSTSTTCCAGIATLASRRQSRRPIASPPCRRRHCSRASCSASTPRSIASIDYFKAAAAGSDVGRRLLLLLGPPSGGKSTLVILLKRGLEEYSHTDDGALYALQGSPVHESPLHLIPASLRAALPRHLRRRDHGRAVAALRARGSTSEFERRLHAHAGRAHVHVRGRTRRRRHLRAARPDHRGHRRPGRLGGPVQGRRLSATKATRAPGRGRAPCTRRAAACSR